MVSGQQHTHFLHGHTLYFLALLDDTGALWGKMGMTADDEKKKKGGDVTDETAAPTMPTGYIVSFICDSNKRDELVRVGGVWRDVDGDC